MTNYSNFTERAPWSIAQAGFSSPMYLSAPLGATGNAQSTGFDIAPAAAISISFAGTYTTTLVHEQTNDPAGLSGWFSVEGSPSDGGSASSGGSTSGLCYVFPTLGIKHRIRVTALTGTIEAWVRLDAATLSSSAAGGGGGGGGTSEALVSTLAPTYSDGSTEPLSMTEKGGLRLQPILPDGTDFDLSDPAVLAGVDGVNAATYTNPVPVGYEQGSATLNQGGPLIQGAVTTAAPSYTTGQTSPLSLTPAGLLRVDGSGGTFSATGPSADDAAATGNPVQVAGKYTSTAPTFADGDTAQLRVTAKGGLIIGGGTADDAAAPAAADTYPAAVGGIYRATLPTYTDGDRVQAHFGQRGALNVQIMGADGSTGATMQATNADGITASGTGNTMRVSAFGIVYSGASGWDRLRGIAGSFGAATGVLAVEQAGAPFSHISTATTTTVKSGAGILHKLVVNTLSAGSITIYDNTSASGTVIAVVNSGAERSIVYDLAFATGLTIVTSSTPDLTVVYR